MSKIGFLGGCFNPPTNIHIRIANKLIQENKLDKVVFVPVNDYYEKENLIGAEHRYNMLKLAIKKYKNLEVDDIEIKVQRKLYAKDAFEIIKKSDYAKFYGENNIFMIMGSDNYKKMPKWKEYNEIKNKYNYIIIERDKNEISSTQIREMIRNDDSKVKQYLPEEVYEYILKHDLYKL